VFDAEHLGESCLHGPYGAITLESVTEAPAETGTRVLVGVIMGSDSDLPVMQAAIDVLGAFGVPCEVRIISAHRTPEAMVDYAKSAADRGLRVIIAGAGGAAHLPGMTASLTTLPVIGVPVPLQHLGGVDSALSILQMPGGIPVATVAVGNAKNAGLLAIRILATADETLRAAMAKYQADLAASITDTDAAVRERFARP
jgi:5-(carboxyamino)imidazole ribonucleotide mutase